MNIVVIGAGGIGAFYGMILHSVGCNVKFIARNENLKYLKQNAMKVTHPNYVIEDKIDTYSIEEFVDNFKPDDIDAVIIATKSMSTKSISEVLANWTKDVKKIPYFISLQNGVENEDVMEKYYNKDYVIGGLTRLIVSHTVSLGHVHCSGEVQTLIGALYPNEKNSAFLEKLKSYLDKTQTTTIICENIRLELWNKLIINNGVNPICALLLEESGPLIRHQKTSKIIEGLMKEAALASNAVGVNLTQDDAQKMFELMTNFQSVKPSMWVDLENSRDLELEDICGVVIKNCEKQGFDAPYTRSVSTILEFLYNRKRGIEN
ncbi:2-dehydropantoate 2-reductase [Malaciobacter pacificus]|uniref:2-dehydropantoate 2-reductase n=1 Tax=Malaciobacter pacificus TaxID=1080223 RepID=A0A5C2HAT9_9BACT|nr:2-dehydropantoate 2-reductase [Malaciobacter pacificus]QEP33422.1 2-dehydropantoate 2-reductase [Malaciobacter pacificus]GGD31322.1 2-dehydropantoate 2-reductase [Malaciobacter pacificus]